MSARPAPQWQCPKGCAQWQEKPCRCLERELDHEFRGKISIGEGPALIERECHTGVFGIPDYDPVYQETYFQRLIAKFVAAGITRRQARAVAMRTVFGCGDTEIAAELEITPSSAGNLCERGLQRLKKLGPEFVSSAAKSAKESAEKAVYDSE